MVKVYVGLFRCKGIEVVYFREDLFIVGCIEEVILILGFEGEEEVRFVVIEGMVFLRRRYSRCRCFEVVRIWGV